MAMPLLSFYPLEKEGAPPPSPTHFEVLLPSGRTGWVPVTAVRPLETAHLCYARTPVNGKSPASTKRRSHPERARVDHRCAGDRLVAEPAMHCPRVLALVGEGIARAAPHVGGVSVARHPAGRFKMRKPPRAMHGGCCVDQVARPMGDEAGPVQPYLSIWAATWAPARTSAIDGS
jgi:hypothetical protein